MVVVVGAGCAWFLWGNSLAFHLHRGNNQQHNNFHAQQTIVALHRYFLISGLKTLIIWEGNREREGGGGELELFVTRVETRAALRQ